MSVIYNTNVLTEMHRIESTGFLAELQIYLTRFGSV